MFGFFHFRGTSIFTGNAFHMIDGMIDAFFNNINMMDIPNFEEIEEMYNKEDDIEPEEAEFIKFEQFKDMYILSIELKGVNMKEMSIRYENDIIDINLNRVEHVKNNYMMNNVRKKHYNKTFDKIEQIDTDRLLKSIDNGWLKITMPKKYSIENKNIIDAEYIEMPKESNTQ